MQLSPVQTNHLYNRACFGLSFNRFQEIEQQDHQEVIKVLFQEAFQADPLKTFGSAPQLKILQQVRSGKITREEARQLVRQEVQSSREKIRELNIEWIGKMQTATSAGLEKLVYFWHDHFGVRVLNGYQAQAHNNTLREYALGNFKDLLRAIAQDGAMLSFLDNQQNVKAKPNENFARELLELFTLGRGNYTEQDIKEAARAFTGWRIDRRTNKFIFDRRNHDEGRKVFLGRQGSFDGDEVIDIICEDPRTARFLAKKLYAFYVADEPNEEHIAAMAEYYYANDYHTESLLQFIFSQPWFYEKKQIQAKIKSPIELINGLHTQLGLTFGNEAGWLLLQRNFAQDMFYPPSVAGWPKGQEWIDSSSLVNRMKLPALMVGLDRIQEEESPELDATDPFQNIDRRAVMQSAELGLWAYQLSAKNDKEQVDIVVDYLFNKALPPALQQKIQAEYAQQTPAKKKYWLFMTLASLPEYQMS